MGAGSIAILTTVPLHVCPSKKKKLAMGASRAARVLRTSWPSIPPITAQLGAHSCAAVRERILKDKWIQANEHVDRVAREGRNILDWFFWN